MTSKLLNHYGIRAKTKSYNEHNAERAGESIINFLLSGKSVVLTSDAGTPLVSDPGYRLVRSALAAGIKVTPLPGASATLAALVGSAIEPEQWLFAGFLPSKENARRKRLEELAATQTTIVAFESPNRIANALKDMKDLFGGDRYACVAREMTKIHETFERGSLTELADFYRERLVKGEIVVVIGPPASGSKIDIESLLTELLETKSVSDVAAEAAELTGMSKRQLYARALELNRKK